MSSLHSIPEEGGDTFNVATEMSNALDVITHLLRAVTSGAYRIRLISIDEVSICYGLQRTAYPSNKKSRLKVIDVGAERMLSLADNLSNDSMTSLRDAEYRYHFMRLQDHMLDGALAGFRILKTPINQSVEDYLTPLREPSSSEHSSSSSSSDNDSDTDRPPSASDANALSATVKEALAAMSITWSPATSFTGSRPASPGGPNNGGETVVGSMIGSSEGGTERVVLTREALDRLSASSQGQPMENHSLMNVVGV